MLSFYKFARFICLLFFRLYFKIEVRGVENLNRTSSGLVLLSNHMGYLDPVFLGLFSKRRLFFMAKKELFSVFILKNIITKLGAFAVDRQNRDLKAVEKAIEIAKMGNVVAMFPQGRRSRAVKTDRPKTGFLRIAVSAGCSVLPCSLFYRGYFPRSRVYVYFGEKVEIEEILNENGFKKENLGYREIRKLTIDVWENVLKLYEEQEEKNKR